MQSILYKHRRLGCGCSVANTPLESCSAKDVLKRLEADGLKRQAALLDGCGLNGAALVRLTDEQLEELGVTPASLRIVLLQWIADHRTPSTTAPPNERHDVAEGRSVTKPKSMATESKAGHKEQVSLPRDQGADADKAGTGDFKTKIDQYLQDQPRTEKISERLKAIDISVGQDLGEMVGKEIAKVVGKTVLQVVGKGVEEMVPFAATAIFIGKFAYECFTGMRENAKIAKELGERVADLMERIPTYMDFFARSKDEKALKYTWKLLEVMTVSFRLAHELGGGAKGRARTCLRFLAAKTTAEAIEKNQRLLVEGVGMVAFFVGGGVVEHHGRRLSKYGRRLSRLEAQMMAQRAAGAGDHLAPLRALKGAADAVRFWTTGGFGAAADVALVSACLLRLASDALLPKRYARLPKRWPHYRDMCEALDTDGDDVTQPVELANFIGDKATVQSAVDEFVEAVMDPSPAAQESPRSLDDVLKPVSMGGDLAKHWARYEEGTRKFIFDDVDAWAASRANKPRAFWVKGTGGLGKSVIAAQLVKRGEAKDAPCWVGARFFCKHDDEARSNPRRAVGTLASQLARLLPEMKAALKGQDPARLAALVTGEEGSVDQCWEEVLAKPLREALKVWPADKHIVVVVDALDELRPVRT